MTINACILQLIIMNLLKIIQCHVYRHIVYIRREGLQYYIARLMQYNYTSRRLTCVPLQVVGGHEDNPGLSRGHSIQCVE